MTSTTMTTIPSPARSWDRSRFYRIEGIELPSVTTVMEVIAKPALGPWYEPQLPDAAAWAVESWKDWAAQVALEPLAIERTVYCRHARSLRSRPRHRDGTGLENGSGDLSRSPPPKRGLPARCPPRRDALNPGPDRAPAEAPRGPRMGG